VTTAYNAAGRPMQLRSESHNLNYAGGITYNALGQMRQINLGNGAVTTYKYYGEGDPWSGANPAFRNYRLWQIRTTGVGGELLRLEYGYDAVGNVNHWVDYHGASGGTEHHWYRYDALDRLLCWKLGGSSAPTSCSGATEVYSYNSIGNIVSKAGLVYDYGPAHPHAVTMVYEPTLGAVVYGPYSYDANGNMTGRTENGKTYQQQWDAENRLVSVTVEGRTTQFYYDGDGNRVKEVSYENLAAGIRATSSGTLNWPDVVTNGDTWADSGSSSSGEFAYTTQTGLQHVQLDLGAVYSVDKVRVWRYAADGCIYNATKTQVSADGLSWYAVFDSAASGTYAETAAGRTYTFPARSVRYVRDYLNGSNKNSGCRGAAPLRPYRRSRCGASAPRFTWGRTTRRTSRGMWRRATTPWVGGGLRKGAPAWYTTCTPTIWAAHR